MRTSTATLNCTNMIRRWGFACMDLQEYSPDRLGYEVQIVWRLAVTRLDAPCATVDVRI